MKAINWDKIREGDILFYGKYSIPRVVEEVRGGEFKIVLQSSDQNYPLTISKDSKRFYKKYPSHSLKCTNALLSPEGTLYPCPFAMHSDLAWILDEMFGWGYHDPSKELSIRGWYKLTIDLSGVYNWVPIDGQPTQPQIDTIFDWCKENRAKLPRFLKEVNHESK